MLSKRSMVNLIRSSFEKFSTNKLVLPLSKTSVVSNSLIKVDKRVFMVSAFHTNLKPSEQQKQPSSADKNKNLFIYEEEKDLEKEVVPTEVFKDEKERIMDEEGVNIPLLVKFWKMYFVRYAVISTLIFGVIYIVWEVTSWLSSITFKNVATVSFYFGFLSALMCCGVTWLAVLAFSIHPSTVYRAAIKKVLANKTLRDNMVTPLTPGKFRAYSYTYPDFNNAHEVPLVRRIQFWKPKRMQLCFQLVDANKKTAMISCDVSRKDGIINLLRNRFTFHSLIVDIPDREDRLFLRGTDQDAVYENASDMKLN
ncbi:hypothetical protein C9374_000166 [Naegleria lovaniensis]|uniref:Uncharacterized protein n=1 Tax=Naegleria lovaniensis TaxID=51637 RepID=A0AA88GX74_NAELO|nr:uncharacterized protein C9374_000166 [Naegleria lovaniensis]KAG2388727.1 hypothetical protein C9374_000166 [Naegleria lovaniensis]